MVLNYDFIFVFAIQTLTNLFMIIFFIYLTRDWLLYKMIDKKTVIKIINKMKNKDDA